MIKNGKGQFLVSTRPVQWGELGDALNISQAHAAGLIRKLNDEGIEASWLKESEKPEALGHNSNLTIFGRELIDESAISQMYDAMRIAPAVQGALMADSHKGYFLPIGGVLALENAVHPFAVGVDIACRIRLNTFDFPVDDLTDSNVASLFEVFLFEKRDLFRQMIIFWLPAHAIRVIPFVFFHVPYIFSAQIKSSMGVCRASIEHATII